MSAVAVGRQRPGSLLPTIKCSDCAQEVDLAELGDHICGSLEPTDAMYRNLVSDMSNPFVLSARSGGDEDFETKTTPSFLPPAPAWQQPPHLPSISKPPRVNLPKINSDIANRPYLATPTGHTFPPLTPSGDVMSAGKSTFARSIARPPSPELSANLDCAFPPFPAPTPTTASNPSRSASGRKVTSGREGAPSRSASRLDRVLTVETEAFAMAPKSPRMYGGEQVLQKMQMLQAGPFTSYKRTNDEQQEVVPVSKGLSVNEQSPAQDMPISQPSKSQYGATRTNLDNDYSHVEPQGIQTSLQGWENQHNDIPAGIGKDVNGESAAPQALAQQNSDPWWGIDHASMSASPTSDEGPQGNNVPATWPLATSYDSGPTLHELPPRKDSANDARVKYRIEDAGLDRVAVQDYELQGMHTPSESESSTLSMSRLSPDGNMINRSPAETIASSIDSFQRIRTEGTEDEGEEDSNSDTETSIGSVLPGERAEQSMQRWPSRKFTRSDYAHKRPQNSATESFVPLTAPMEPILEQTEGNPVPRPFQHETLPLGRNGTVDSGQHNESLWSASTQVQAAQWRANGVIQSDASDERKRPPFDTAMNTKASGLVGPSSLPVQYQRTAPKRAYSSKSVCRGCKQVIEGKSVKAADGRLTGRWHKTCFVCQSCKAPFTTADFYVIRDEPYCEQHYHEKNGSLCSGCYRGIEGQYLETSGSTSMRRTEKKFHPRCFTCATCRIVLAQDYFEISGSILCERHAMAAMRSQSRLALASDRGLHAERRTTKLINPIIA